MSEYVIFFKNLICYFCKMKDFFIVGCGLIINLLFLKSVFIENSEKGY